MMTLFLHAFAAALATWRVTDLVAHDRVTAALRRRLPTYPWSCTRCVSVWAGALCTLLYITVPWLNWPFALAWLYLWHVESVVAGRAQQPVRYVHLAIARDGAVTLARTDVGRDDTLVALTTVVAGLTQTRAPQARP